MRTCWLLIVGIFLVACQSAPVQPESVTTDAPAAGVVKDPAPIHQDSAPATEADRLLQADRDFAARSLTTGAPEAFYQFMDEQGMQLPAAGDPVVGPENVRAALAQGPPTILTWEPRYAEVLTADWGWTWGEWQAHEPGAGGRRLAQGKYLNLWKKQPDGSWKVRLDVGNVERKP
jgi:ketosteroid isomerase-like protein